MSNLSTVTNIGVGICTCHESPINISGQVITCSSNVMSNGRGNARVTDILLAQCGHTGILIKGSSSVRVNGLSVARIGDNFAGCFSGVMIEGASNVLAGG